MNAAPRPVWVQTVRSYGAILVAVAAFLVTAVVVSPLPRDEEQAAGAVQVPTAGLTPGSEPAGGPAQAERPTGGADADASAPAHVTGCGARAEQVPGDPYSPPCVAFSGSNGGATSRGVTDKDIAVSVRILDIPSAAQVFSQISGQAIQEGPESMQNTIQAYADYFNQRFQLYGRKIVLKFYKGKGSAFAELLGGGQEAALADATTAARQIGAFAELNGISLPYADALSQQKVISFGAPYPSRDWYNARRPYVWSSFPDGTSITEAAADWVSSRMPGGAAQFGGPSVDGKPRTYAVVAPENAEYQESVNAFVKKLDAVGIHLARNLKYRLDLGSMPNQASSIVAQLKDAGVTSLICACDPVMLALGMVPKSNEQGYDPEWISLGIAFSDQDLVSQLYDGRQWGHALGIAFNARPEPLQRSFPYAAFKQVRPDDEPAFGFEEVYYQMYLLAIGLQMAGPDLTPQTFEAGMFAYPRSSGPKGSWHFGPGDYTPTDDFREVWWDPDATSTQNGKPGAWIDPNPGRRYLPGQVPRAPGVWFQGAAR